MRTIAIGALGIGPPGGGRSATLNLLREMFLADRASQYILLVTSPEPELASLALLAKLFEAELGDVRGVDDARHGRKHIVCLLGRRHVLLLRLSVLTISS